MNKLGKELIEKFNKIFNVKILQTEENQKKIVALIVEIGSDSLLDEIMEGSDYGDCSNCDERRGEPMRNEGYD